MKEYRCSDCGKTLGFWDSKIMREKNGKTIYYCNECIEDVVEREKNGKKVSQKAEFSKSLDKINNKSEYKIEGLGGWLILVIISLCLSAISSIVSMFFAQPTYLLVINTVSLIIDIFAIMFFFQKRKIFINVYRTSLIMIAIYVIVMSYIPDPYTRLSLSALAPIGIWIRYTFQSKRVKNTFVN